uniref:G-protein coupled receptors family 1 profile domain-containing protein n=1 Tax=Nannospalax galili TaxID=1026970 RepID=A0A8C6QYL9_NANGA
ITDCPELQAPLFLVFLLVYVTTMVGNLGLIFLIWKDPTPMYLFLGSLAFADACTSSSVTPKMLLNFLTDNDFISMTECFSQFYFFCYSATTECFLLVGMAYDCYVAICNPLLYLVVMSNRLCILLISVSYLIGLLFRLTFFRSNIIDHFYCEILPLYTILSITFMSIVVSYAHVLFDILKKKSEKGRSKAFSICSAHLLSVSLFYGTLFFMYVSHGSGPSKYQEKMYYLFDTIVIPLPNPFIYSLRNKDVLSALRKLIK